MKKIINISLVGIILAGLLTTSASAAPRHHNGWHGNKKVIVVKPRRHHIVRHHHGWNSYTAGAIISGIVIGTIIADANTVSPSKVHEIKSTDGITYYFVNGEKCILVDGKFHQVT